MQHDAAFHQGFQCLLRLKQQSGKVIHHNLENSSCNPLKYTMGSTVLIVSVCMGKSIKIQRVNGNKSKKGGKNQESKQSSTTPDQGYHMGK